jgi:dTDP-4-dehydrorhamnose 3,5-epimerase
MTKDFLSLPPEGLYWFLGLFVTDGHFEGKCAVTFTFQKRDRDLLTKICYLFDIGEERIRESNVEEREYVHLRIRQKDSKSLVDFLRNKGFTTNKTFNMPQLEIPDGYARHFLRGILDGDGSISASHDTLQIEFTTGANNFADFICVLIAKVDQSLKVHKYSTTPLQKPGLTHDLFAVKVVGTDAEKFLLKIYDWCEYYGERKFTTFVASRKQQSSKIAAYRDRARRKGLDQDIEGVKLIQIKAFEDQRGYLSECYRVDQHDVPTSLVYASLTHPSLKRGPHVHYCQTDIFTFGVAGLYKIWLLDDRECSPTYQNVKIIYGGRDNWLRVVVPPGVIHAYQNISKEDGLSINCVSRLYAGMDKKYGVDEIRLDNTEFAEFLFGL